MITINLLKNHPHTIPRLAEIWHEVLGKIWLPEIGIEEIEALSYQELQQGMPLSFIALNDEIPVGFCTITLTEDFLPDLGPWISDLVVDPKYQKQGIGKMLLDATVEKAKQLGIEKLYLFTFDPKIPDYYIKLGWKTIAMDEFNGHSVTIMEIVLF